MRSHVFWFLFAFALLCFVGSAYAQCELCQWCGFPYRQSRIQCSGNAGGGQNGYRDCLTVGDCNGCIGLTCTGSAPQLINSGRAMILVSAVVNGQRYAKINGLWRPVLIVAQREELTSGPSHTRSSIRRKR